MFFSSVSTHFLAQHGEGAAKIWQKQGGYVCIPGHNR